MEFTSYKYFYHLFDYTSVIDKVPPLRLLEGREDTLIIYISIANSLFFNNRDYPQQKAF